MSNRAVYIASDHRGFALKAQLVAWLRQEGYEPFDLGPSSDARCDALDYAVKLAEALRKDTGARGVLICGTGQAMTMTANRYRHIRAALCSNATMARMAREHNDANVLTLGADVVGVGMAQESLAVFLDTEFLGGRYAERNQLLADLGGL